VPFPAEGDHCPSSSLFPGLWLRAAAQVLAQFADPKVLHFSCPTRSGEGPSRVRSRFFAVRGGTRRKSKHRRVTCGFQSWVLVSTHPSPPNQTNATLSDLLWPLRHVLFLTPSWNWLSSSKDQVLFLVPPLHPSSL
jgi:hypothetical protein